MAAAASHRKAEKVRLHRLTVPPSTSAARKGSSGHSLDTDGLRPAAWPTRNPSGRPGRPCPRSARRTGPVHETRRRPCAVPPAPGDLQQQPRQRSLVATADPQMWASVFSPTQSSITHQPSSFATGVEARFTAILGWIPTRAAHVGMPRKLMPHRPSVLPAEANSSDRTSSPCLAAVCRCCIRHTM